MKTKTSYTLLLLLTSCVYYLNAQGTNCNNPINLICGTPVSGTTVGGQNDFTLDNYSCHSSNNNFDAEDRVYRIIPSATGIYDINLSKISKDLDIFLLESNCSSGQCIAKGTNSGTSNERIGSITLYLESTYYLVIDGYNSAQVSSYELSLSCPGGPSGFNCDGIPPVSCGSTINSTNANAVNNFNISSYTCHTSNNNFSAPDRIYYLNEDFPGVFEIELSGLANDLDLFIMKDLCPGGSGGVCILKSTNSGTANEKIGPIGLEAGQYYIVIDGYNSNQISNYTLKVNCQSNCQGIEELTCGQINTKSTLNSSNKFGKSDYSACFQTNNNFDGNDVIFKYNHNAFHKNANVVIWGYSTDLDLFLLKDCNKPAICAKSAKNQQDNYEFIDFTGLPYGDYYIVVDGYNTSQKSQFQILVSCQYICAFEGITEPIECGQTKQGTTVNSINAFSKYSCMNDYVFSGPEKYYFFNPPQDGEYVMDLSGFTNDMELFVVDLANCTYNPVCLAKSTNPPGQNEQIKISLKKNQSITIIVDGALGAAGSYSLKVACPASTNRCTGIPAITCDQEISASNVNGGDDFSILDYPCHQSSNNFNAPDRLYQINVSLPKTIEISLTGLAADLDLFLLEGICLNGNPVTGKCIAKSTNQGNTNEKVGPVLLEAGKTYYVSVDGYNQIQLSNFKLKLTCITPPAPKCMDCFQCFRWKKGGGEHEVYFENSFCEEDYIGLNQQGGLRGAVTYDWDFSEENVSFLDGTNKSSQNPKCKFPRAGKFKVCFRVYQLGNLIYECCRTIYVNPCSLGPVPRLDYTINESSGEVQFDASASTGAEGYDWDFGGGTAVVAHDTKPKSKYTPGKCYTVCLVVYNGCGSSKICITVCPGYSPCTPLAPKHPAANLTLTDDKLQFSNISSTFWEKIEWKLSEDMEFDQGSNTNSANPRFRFKKPGYYIICAIFYNKCHKICICWNYYYPGINPAPKCMDCFQCFRWKKGGGEHEVYFENNFCEEDYIGLNQHSGLRGAVTYDWDFSGESVSFLDGTSKSSQNPKCKFPRAGKFKVCFRVYQLGNLIFECCRTIYINPCQIGPVPHLNYTFNESSGEVQFDASASVGADGYDWDFGGGTAVVTHDTKPKRKYVPGKCYTVCLIIYNGCGSSKICITICPGYSPCMGFPLAPKHPVPAMSLTDDKLQVSNISVTEWDKIEWKLPEDAEFDQGSSGSAANPGFRFKKPGSYVICAIFYYKCHKICICWTYYYPGSSPTPITCEKICPPLITSYRDCQSFEEYVIGNISPQKNNDPWILSVAGTDGQIVNGSFKSGTKSLSIKTSALSTYYSINRPLNHISRLEWQMYIPSGSQAGWDIRTAAFNFQLPFDVAYQNGLGSARSKSTAKDEIIGFSYPVNQWFRNVLLFNAADKTIELWINNKFINKVTYELAAGAQDMIRELRFKNGSNGAANSNYFIDDLCFSEIVLLITCQQHIDPVCVNGRTFNNSCYAQAAGYSEYEWTKGACVSPATKLIFDIDDNICDVKTQKVFVPVKVYNFKNIRSFTMSVQVADIAVASINSITSTTLPTLNVAQVDPGKTFALLYNLSDGKTLVDGSVGFTIECTLNGNIGQSTAIHLIAQPVEIKAATIENNITSPIPVEVKSGSVCLNDSKIQISGTVRTRTNIGINNAAVTNIGPLSSSTLTDINGQYSYVDLPQGFYTLEAEKMTDPKNGLDIFDLAAIEDHILHKSLLTDPYLLLAADVNDDGSIDIFDLSDLQDVILGRKLNFNGDRSWKFVPTNETLTEAKVKTKSYLTKRSFDANTVDKSSLDFWGIKTGDIVAESANPKDILVIENKGQSVPETRSIGVFSIELQKIKARKDQLIYYPILVTRFENIRGFQFQLNWDPGVLKLEQIEILNSGLPGFTTNNLYYDPMKPGILNAVWVNSAEVTVSPGSKLFFLVFRATGSRQTESEVKFQDVKVADFNGSVPGVKVINGTITITDISTKLDLNIRKYAEYAVFPNPVNHRMTIESTEIFSIISISDAFGKIHTRLERGQNQYHLDLETYAPGLYFITTSSNNRLRTHKFIIAR